MKIEENIEETAIRVCDAMAGAVELYASISGSGVSDLPEHFVPAYVLVNLGPVLTITMETNSKKLWEWSCDIRRRWNGLTPGQPTPVMPPDYITKVGQRRADLVLFRGDHSKKNETDFLCFVEFKTWKDISPDIQKIQDWFQFIDTCPWGMACGLADVTSTEWLKIIRDHAERAGDKLVLGRVARPLGIEGNFQTFARILANPNYKAPGV